MDLTNVWLFGCGLSTIITVIVLGSIVLFFGITIAFLVPFLRQFGSTSAVVKGGKTAAATLLNMQQTGTEVSSGGYHSFGVIAQLQVQPSDGEPFVATVKQVIPLLDLQQMQPGSTILVRYNPADKTQVAFVRNLGNLAMTLQADGMDPQAAQKLAIENEILEDDLGERGVSAPAQIVTAEKMGLRLYNGTAEMFNLTLDVQPPQGTSFRAQAHAAIVQASFGKYQAGARVTVKYDPADTSRVVLVGAR